MDRNQWPASTGMGGRNEPEYALGAIVLVLWGGTNTVVVNLVLSGVLPPGENYDHAAMIGHGWLWDPLFLLWGLALAIGLFATKHSRAAGRT